MRQLQVLFVCKQNSEVNIREADADYANLWLDQLEQRQQTKSKNREQERKSGTIQVLGSRLDLEKESSMQSMQSRKQWQAVLLFILIACLFSWSLFFASEIWLLPIFRSQNNRAAYQLVGLVANMLAMLGPAIAAIILWRFYHKEPFPSWKWSRAWYYPLIVLAMLTLWTLPALVGLFLGSFQLLDPIEPFIWIMIGITFLFSWFSGMGEETGWCAYLLPRLTPRTGKTGALVISGTIRGLWHLPLATSPLILQVMSGEEAVSQIILPVIVFSFQLALSNILLGSLFGWLWYRTESIPLLGWVHQWFDTTRDIASWVIIGFTASLWYTIFGTGIIFIIGVLCLRWVAREENSRLWQVMQVLALEGKQKTQNLVDQSADELQVHSKN